VSELEPTDVWANLAPHIKERIMEEDRKEKARRARAEVADAQARGDGAVVRDGEAVKPSSVALTAFLIFALLLMTVAYYKRCATLKSQRDRLAWAAMRHICRPSSVNPINPELNRVLNDIEEEEGDPEMFMWKNEIPEEPYDFGK
jgi:hypothetical protein